MRLYILLGFTILVFSTTALAQQRVAFITSVSGTADLSSWLDAGAATGLAAGDAICQSRAGAASLDNAINFVALLSDSEDDAYCRLHNFLGKRSDMCGQASLPVDAGPWINTKGENLAEPLPLMLFPSLKIYRTLRFDEFGDAVDSRYFTGSWVGADYIDGDEICSDWTGTGGAGFVRTGSSNASASGVFSVGGVICSTHLRLACFETVAGEPLQPELPKGSLAFVTEARGNGDLGSWPLANGESGVDAADEICQASALNADMPRPEDFIAWISNDLIDAKDRLEYSGPWFRQDGVIVAHDVSELTGGNLNATINLTENLAYISN